MKPLRNLSSIVIHLELTYNTYYMYKHLFLYNKVSTLFKINGTPQHTDVFSFTPLWAMKGCIKKELNQ